VEGLAWCAAAKRDHERAAVLLGAAHRLRELTGITLDGLVPFALAHQHAEHTTRTALGAANYAHTHARGAELGYHETIAAALHNQDDQQPIPAQDNRHNGHPVDHRAGTMPARPATPLTRREHDVAAILGHTPGATNKDIAARLVVSVRTIDTHIEHILNKLGVDSRGQIAAWAATLHNDTAGTNTGTSQ
jgi:non-specific serine/threonine protein kinase